jgi:hypothetical protein
MEIGNYEETVTQAQPTTVTPMLQTSKNTHMQQQNMSKIQTQLGKRTPQNIKKYTIGRTKIA